MCVRFGSGTRAVDAGTEELVEHVVLVGCQDQPADRQPHHARDVARADVAEVARRYGKGDLLFVIHAAGRREVALK
jgi:hypothetical protein